MPEEEGVVAIMERPRAFTPKEVAVSRPEGQTVTEPLRLLEADKKAVSFRRNKRGGSQIRVICCFPKR